VAATGLLGINPYYKGTEIDVSKPVNLAIQLHQKEEAKKEALDKYFMDYEKSLNPAGMRQQDQDVFLRKLQENKAYYLKNRDKILNPAKYGAEAQSEYMSRFKGILSDIDRSKQLAANGKVIATAMMDARKNNRTIPKEVADAIYNNELSMGDSRHQAFDPVNFDAYDKHDPTKYQQSIYSKIKPTELPGEKVWNKSKGEYEIEVTKDITKDALNQIGLEVNGELQKDRGLQDTVKGIMMDPNKLAQVAQSYKTFTGKDMSVTPNNVALAYTIALKPKPDIDYQKFDNWKERENYRISLDNEQARKAVQGVGTGIVQAALNNPRKVDTKNDHETWHDLPLPSEVMKGFTVPGVERSWVKNTNYDPNDPDSQEFISKPGTKMTQLPVDFVTVRDGKVYGFIKPVDSKGNPVAGKADQMEIPVKVLGDKIHKALGAQDSKSGAGAEAITKELEEGFKKILPKSNTPSKTYSVNGKKYTEKQLIDGAKYYNMSLEDYKKELNIK